jgi:hypothetical protein
LLSEALFDAATLRLNPAAVLSRDAALQALQGFHDLVDLCRRQRFQRAATAVRFLTGIRQRLMTSRAWVSAIERTGKIQTVLAGLALVINDVEIGDYHRV